MNDTFVKNTTVRRLTERLAGEREKSTDSIGDVWKVPRRDQSNNFPLCRVKKMKDPFQPCSPDEIAFPLHSESFESDHSMKHLKA